MQRAACESWPMYSYSTFVCKSSAFLILVRIVSSREPSFVVYDIWVTMIQAGIEEVDFLES